MPSSARTRPTSDRVREAAFSLIADWAGTAGEPADTMLERFSFLDLFAGSGAVALEAASRGADPVVAVEFDAAAVGVARRNADQLRLGVAVTKASVETFLSDRTPTAFDVVWLDPPYAVGNDDLARIVATILGRGWLAPDGLVVAERSTRDTPFTWPDELNPGWSRRYGETTLYFGSVEG